MGNKIEFGYFHEHESEQFSFYRIPKLLFTDEHFRDLSCEAKVLYGLMLDRMCLSLKNHWIDREKRVYIVFTLEQVTEYLNCGRDKGMKILAELDCKKGIGLIERVKQGFGKPDAIYVKNFIVKQNEQLEQETAETPENETSGNENEISGSETPESVEGRQEQFEDAFADNLEDIGTNHEHLKDRSQSTELERMNLSRSESPTYRSRKNRPVEVGKTDLERSEKSTCRGRESPPVQVEKTDPNNTDINKTDRNDTDLINLSVRARANSPDEADRITAYTEIIRSNIEYEYLVMDSNPEDRKQIDMIVSLMAETIGARCETVVVARAEYPYAYVVNKLLRVGYFHVRYIVSCLKQQREKINNIKAYVLACIFNAPTMMDAYYRSEARQGMYAESGA
ncbi:MAG: replication initiator protein A [Lachnospiraceae bacterium]|nr:replication initiator protein A [Lachnospiraceae bacterium]